MRIPFRIVAIVALATPSPSQTFVAGQTYWGTTHYVEYIAGSSPIVLSAPHGGYLDPKSIPDRTWGVRGQDRRTQELARAIADALAARTGQRPHLIISHLHRVKLDPNREIREAAQGNPIAERAWREYHGFIVAAEAAVTRQYGHGHYYDIHGHGHPIAWLELGYLLSASDLRNTDATLRRTTFRNRSSLRALTANPKLDFPMVLRGKMSLGGMLAARGYRAVPSPADPHPGGNSYFRGGYSTARHGSRNGGSIDGTQIEHPWAIRQSARTQEPYARALAATIDAFFKRYYAHDLSAGPRVTVQVDRQHISERGGRGSFVFTRTGDVSRARLLPVVVSGTAAAGRDFAPLPTSVSFAPNTRLAKLDVVALEDRLAEGSETVTVRANAGKDSASRNAATITIIDDEPDASLALELALDKLAGAQTPDTSGHKRHATLLPNATAGPRTTTGKIGNALAFDGRDDGIRIAPFSPTATQEFSLGLWFRSSARSPSGYQYLVSQGKFGTPESLQVYIAEATKTLRTHLVYRNRLGTNGPLDVAIDLQDGHWHHYALVARITGTSEVWIDGVRRATAMLGGDVYRPTTALYFGTRSDRSVGRYLRGALDAIVWSERAWTRPEVRDAFDYRPGSSVLLGTGCAGTRGTPMHTIGGRADIGRTIEFVVANGPAPTPGLLAIGASATAWNSVPLPLHLAALGARNCWLRVSLDLLLGTATDTNGASRHPLPLPLLPPLIGTQLHGQFLLLDRNANGLGVIVSNGTTLRLGGIR